MSNLIQKKVSLYVGEYEIIGKAHLKEGFRIVDHLNQARIRFIPLTEVIISKAGKIVSREAFVCVNKNMILFSQSGQQGPIFLVQGNRLIDEHHDEIRIVGRLPGPSDSFLLYRIAGIPNASRIKQPHRHPFDVQPFVDQVTRGAGKGGDDGTVRPGQRVHQAGFAHVGAAAYNCLDPLPQHPALVRR